MADETSLATQRLLERVQAQRRILAVVDAVVEKYTGGEPPEVLYHYTSSHGVVGIFAERGLFLSDARFLNDASELTYGTSIINSRLQRALDTLPQTTASIFREAVSIKEQTRATRTWDLEPTVYVGSFCTAGDLLSQWRAYGSDGGGRFALGFHSQTLATAVVPMAPSSSTVTPGRLRRVLYKRAEQEALVDEAIAAVFSEAQDSLSADDYRAIYPVASLLMGSARVALAAQIKSPTFRQEEEWRLVHDGHRELVRVANGALVPYCLCWFPAKKGPERGFLPLREIVVGPSSRNELNALAAQSLLVGYGDSVKITRSGIPLRS